MLSWRSNHSCDTLSSGDVLSNSGENKWLCEVILVTNLRDDHIATQTQAAFAKKPDPPLDLKSLCPRHLGTKRDCFQFVSERARERVVPPTSCLISCRVLKTRTLDAGSNVACLAQSKAAESHSVGCCLEQFCCGGRDLVDALEPVLVHWDPPIADSCLGKYSRLVSCDDDRPTWEK